MKPIRYYIVMIRDSEWRCGGQEPDHHGDNGGEMVWSRCIRTRAFEARWRQEHNGLLTGFPHSCEHEVTQLDTWKPYESRDGISVYTKLGSAKRRAKLIATGGDSWIAWRGKRESKIMYFEHDDLCTYTEDPEQEYQEHEAKMDRYAQKAAEAQKRARG